MRLLADLCIARLTISGLRADGHDVLALSEARLNPADKDVLELAASEGRILLSEDADFGALLWQQQSLATGVLRLEQINAQEQLASAREAIALHADGLTGGAMVTVRRGRIRISRRG